MDPTLTLNSHHKLIQDIYANEGLKCLRGEKDDDYHLNGKNIISWHYDACNCLNDSSFNSNDSLDNLLFYSDEILFFTANLYLLVPYLNDPTLNAIKYNGIEIYPFDQGFADKRFNMFAEIIYEKLYSYWSQLALLLKAKFMPNVKNYDVNFSKIIEKLSKQNINSENLNWLISFKEKHYKDLNNDRNKIVHIKSLDTKFKTDYIASAFNSSDMRNLIKKRADLPAYFKGHIDFTLMGFEKTLNLILES